MKEIAMPEVSIIIPTYNSSHYLGEAVSSILAQTYTDYEIIIVDDGSTDHTREVVEKLEGPIRYFWRQHRGPAGTRNFGITQACGRFIAFLDADDLWVPTKLDRQMQYLAAHPEFALVYSDLEEMGQDGEVLLPSKFNALGHDPRKSEGWVFERELLHPFLYFQTIVARRDVVDDIGAIDENFTWGDDLDFFFRITYKYPVGCIAEQLVKRRRHDGNLTNKFNDTVLRSWILVLIKQLEVVALRPVIRLKLRHFLAGLCTRLGRHELGQQAHRKAREEFLRSLGYWPFWNPAVFYLPLTLAPDHLVGWLKLVKNRLPH